MTKHTLYKMTGCFAVAFLSLLPVQAQENEAQPQTVTSVDRLKMESLWISNSNNAAGAIIDMPARYTTVGFGYHLTEGDFKRVQSGRKAHNFEFNTEGGGVFDNVAGMYLWGSFKYERNKLWDAQYNASVIDPLRGMPYILADSNKSRWIHQNYNLKMRVATPKLWNHVIFGLEGTYDAGIGAKQMDPRPKVYMYKLGIAPSVAYTFGKGHSVGADFTYYNRREDGSARTLNTNRDQIVWEMLAPGFFTAQTLSSGNGQRIYNANSMGGGIQYGYNSDNFRLLLSGDYAQRVEDVTSSYTKPKMVGTVKDELWSVKLAAMYRTTARQSLFFRMAYSDQSLDGIEYLQVYDNTSYDVQEWITIAKNIRSNYATKEGKFNLDYMIHGEDNSYLWKFGVDASIKKYSYIYYIPESTQDIDSYQIGAYINKNFRLGENNALLLCINGSLNKNTKSEQSYGGVHADDVGYTEFAMNDFYYLSSGYTQLGASLTYSFLNIRQHSASLYAGVGINYIKANDHKDLFDQRTFTDFKIGVAF